jgi:hypothetical protein
MLNSNPQWWGGLPVQVSGFCVPVSAILETTTLMLFQQKTDNSKNSISEQPLTCGQDLVPET